MYHDYNFTDEEKKLLYKELKDLIESKSYKILKKEYSDLITNISKNIHNISLKDPLAITYLLKKNINNLFPNNMNEINDIDLDMLYKLWGSRVFTYVYSNRHIVSFINDILIRNGYISCKIIARKEKKIFPTIIENQKKPNDLLLCIIIENKKVYIDLEDEKLIEFNNFFNHINFSSYKSINSNSRKSNFYYINYNIGNQLELNSDHLFVMSSYITANEFTKKDYYSKAYIKDYITFLDDFNYNLFDIGNNNIDIISDLSKELSIKQNDIYKRVKKYDR